MEARFKGPPLDDLTFPGEDGEDQHYRLRRHRRLLNYK